MRKTMAVCVVLLSACPGLLAAASTITELSLADGRDANNTIGAAVFNASAVGPLRIAAITADFDRKAKIVRRTGRKFPPAAAGPEYELDAKIDLATLLTEALRGEAGTMGFRVTTADDFGWDVKGTLKDVYLESRQVYMGATLFYGYMDVDFQVQKAGGAPATERLRAHKYYQAFNAGLGRRDEARAGLAHLLVEGAQEMVSRLNRSHFGAPPDPIVEKKVPTLTGKSRIDLHVVGLSGAKAAVPVLIALIPKIEDENDRAAAIDALGRLGAPEAAPFLAGRYAKEDEDCRWATVKAMDAIGGQEAKAVVEKGMQDEHDPIKRLSAKVLAIAKKD
jgi:hypothetical protein